MTRGLSLAALLLVLLAASTAPGQEPSFDRQMSLSERFIRFRHNLWGSEDQEQSAQQATNAYSHRSAGAGTTRSSGLPRVSSRDLLPDDMRSSRGAAPTPPRVASLPERYQRDATTSTSPGAANRGSSSPTTRSANTAPVRRSPLQSPRHEFDAAELRRDLVATNAPSAGTPSMKSSLSGSESSETERRSATSAQRTTGSLSDRYAAADTVATSDSTSSDNSIRKSAVDAPQRLTPTVPSETRSTTTMAIKHGDALDASPPPVAAQADLRNLFAEGARPSDLHSMDLGAPDPGNVLLSQKMPQIVSQVSGPRQIIIGREATFRVWIANRGDLAADELVTRVKVPAWAELKSVTPSNGSFDRSPDAAEGEVKWVLARLDTQQQESLELVLVAKESRPVELAVDWTHAPIDSRTVVEVREPKLEMTVSGPGEVLFGRPQVYRITLSNPGTATAEGVVIHLLPPGAGESKGSSHPFGNLTAGETKTAEVELTAREPGKLFVKASATAAGGLTVAADKEIFCRKPELEVDWRGPERKYAGTEATYYFRVRNPGTAPAEKVQFQVELPAGFEVSEASSGAASKPNTSRIVWNLNDLQPGDDRYLELKGTITQPGPNEFHFAAASHDDLVRDSGAMTTEVVALADLKLQVSDPIGPIAVGEDAIYEIRVINRGASAAEQVMVAALFSEGIEPQTAEGIEHSIADGRVAFQAIEKLLPGKETTLRVRARGVAPGTHLFRVEVVCPELETKLAAEETTRFFTDDVSPIQTADQSSAPAAAESRYAR